MLVKDETQQILKIFNFVILSNCEQNGKNKKLHIQKEKDRLMISN